MKLKVLILSLAGALSLSAMAQEVNTKTYKPNEPGKNVTFLKDKFTDHWFVQLQGGLNILKRVGVNDHLSGPNHTELDWTKRPTMSLGIGFGKWHTPYFATRLMADYNTLHVWDNRWPGKMFSTMSINPHIDFIFDLFNYFGTYNPERFFSLRPYIGVGWAASEITVVGKNREDNPYNKNFNFINVVSGHFGLSFDFRFNERVALNIVCASSIANYTTLNNNPYKPNDILGLLRGGLTFNINKTSFEPVEPMDYALLNDLNTQINDLRARNAELEKRPESCPECPEVEAVAPVQNIVDNVVFFRLNKWRVDYNQMLNVYNTAEFVKANNAPIKVVGYADEKTGSADYNMKLSEKRAREVARILVDKYGVPSELITIDFKGSSVQPFNKNAWNRVVIMKANN